MGAQLFLAPLLWLGFIFVMHASREPLKAVLGWALIFAPFYLVVGLAELYARVEVWRRERAATADKKRRALVGGSAS